MLPNRIASKPLLAVLGVLIIASVLGAQTTVRFTGEVLVEDVPRLGAHASGDNYYDGYWRKNRVEENFEGTIARSIREVDIEAGNVVVTKTGVWPSLGERYIEEIASGGEVTYIIASGPDQWKAGRITAIEMLTPSANSTLLRLTLDEAFTPDPGKNAIIIDALLEDLGFVDYMKLDAALGSEPRFNNGTASNSSKVEITSSDGAPTFGGNSLRIDGGAGAEFYNFFTHTKELAPTNGVWKARFWCRTESGSPALTVSASPGPATVVAPSGSWTQHEVTIPVNNSPEANQVDIRFIAEGGSVLIDDVEIWVDGDANPTAFADQMVDILQFIKPGVMRTLINRGDRMENRISGRLRSYAMSTYGRIEKVPWGMHEFFELGEHVGFDPWFTLPGQMTPEDMRNLVEYLAAPADTGWGQLRASLGHPEPWTDSFDAIFLQIGNEIATFSGTGFDGPGYWEGLMAAVKSSPHYSEKLRLVVDSQVSAGYNLDNTPSSDNLCHSGYMTFGIYESMLNPYGTDAELASYILSMPWMQYTQPNGALSKVLAATSRGREPCVYEGGNFHTTFGDETNPVPIDTINNILTSHVGGLASVLNMLILQREHGCRYQNSFNFNQNSFSAGGSFGNLKNVRLWGGMLSMREENRRYRPRFLSLAAVNQVAGGAMVRMDHQGAEAGDTLTITDGLYSPAYGNRLESSLITSTVEMRAIESFGYRDGNRYGLVLINQDTANARDVVIEYAGTPATAQWWRVAPSNPFFDNEEEHPAPQVTMEEGAIAGFASGHTVTLPACGLLTLSWEAEPDGSLPPIADAGPDQFVIDADDSGQEQVTVDAGASEDPDGVLTAYEWTFDGAPAGNAEVARMLLPVGTHTLMLTVTDSNGLTGSDTMVVEVGRVFDEIVTVEDAGGASPAGGSPATQLSFTATTSGEPNYLLVAAISEVNAVAQMTYAGVPMELLHSVSESSAKVQFFGVATSTATGVVEAAYGGNVWGTQIFGYAFLAGVNTGSPVRATGGATRSDGSGLDELSFGYNEAPLAGDVAMVASYRDESGQVAITPAEAELIDVAAGSHSGAIALDSAFAASPYGTTVAYNTTQRQAAAGIIIAGDPEAVSLVADSDRDGVADEFEEFLHTDARRADYPADLMDITFEDGVSIFRFPRSQSSFRPNATLWWSRDLVEWFDTGYSLSVTDTQPGFDWVEVSLETFEPAVFWSIEIAP